MHTDALIFTNLLNGNDIAQVGRVFDKTAKEVIEIFDRIILKIKSYRFERCFPFLVCDTLQKARENRIELLHALERINLDKEAKFSKIVTYENLNPAALTDAMARGGK